MPVISHSPPDYPEEPEYEALANGHDEPKDEGGTAEAAAPRNGEQNGYTNGEAAAANGGSGGGSQNGSRNEGHRANPLDTYTVVLAADEQLKLPGLPGELRVWIGDSAYQPTFPEHMAEDTATMPALGESATVEPFAPAFGIEPQITQCIRIVPSGSEVRFTLTPKKTGTFEVGANVYLYNSLDCSGAPVPKTAATLKVVVDVDRKEIVNEKTKELWDVFWEKLLEFWGALVALIFGLFLFLVRGKLKQWFGFDGK